MNKVFKCLIIQCLLLASFGASAHSLDVSSTMLVEESKDQWVLQIRTALTAFEYVVENQFGTSSYKTAEEFQDLVIQHVRNHVSIKTNNGIRATLENGVAKLGHETSVTFEVSGIADALELLEITNTSFKDIARNQSALIVLKKGFAKDQFTLDDANGHSAKLNVTDAKFELVAVKATAEGSYWPYAYAVEAFLLLMFVGYFIRKKPLS